MRVHWERQGTRSRLSLHDSGGLVSRVEYTNAFIEGLDPEDDPTPFAEPEHWDFGLFLKNVLEDEGRRHRLYRDGFMAG
ncbi:hypothetical protein OG474_11380 [Kribbella sp. NBC_01505]|uniref:hypothetical protein n=1 Tax=Kribbella sp. NBC_01505 TaxID=2903580 RepID=UPI00386E294B